MIIGYVEFIITRNEYINLFLSTVAGRPTWMYIYFLPLEVRIKFCVMLLLRMHD